MEGVLHVRVCRGKLLRGWQKRYYVLSDDGALREFADVAATGSISASAAADSTRRRSTAEERAVATLSGMVFAQELLVVGATSIKTLPFPLVGRNHVFQLAKKGEFRLALAAKSADDLQQWLRALRAVVASTGSGRRQRSPARSSRTQTTTVAGSTPWTRTPSSSLDLGSESEFVDVPSVPANDLARFAGAYEWRHERVRVTQDVVLAGVRVPRGSVLVAANGISLQTLSTAQVTQLLARPHSRALALALRFLQPPHKRGVLRCVPCTDLSTQLRSFAQPTCSGRDWPLHTIELDGDVLTCCPRADGASESTPRRVLPLTLGCTVKTVHEVVADRRGCFVVALPAHSMLFQARSDADVQRWVDAIQRAITFADGNIVVHTHEQQRPLSFNHSLQLESSLNMRSLQSSLAFADDDDRDDRAGSIVDDGRHPRLRRVSADPLPFAAPVAAATPLPATDLSDMLVFLQRSGRVVEALQLVGRNTTHRCAYWPKLFQWATEPIDSDAFAALLTRPLVDADNVQVQKDIPRTAKWLAASAGSPVLTPDASHRRLASLEHVLHAFLSSCTSHIRTDDDHSDSESDSNSDHGAVESQIQSQSFYMQGMNGLAFILLDVLHDDERQAFAFLRGIVARVLPHVFGIRSIANGGNAGERDHFDLFSSLAEVGGILDDVVALHLPHFHRAMAKAGLPTNLLAYKWFPTLFSDISLIAHAAQLPYETLLVAWDMCLLMGLEGIFCVALALCSAAEQRVVAVATAGGRDASAEQMSHALVRVLAHLSPDDLVTGVCEVLELCSHHVLLKLRNGHRRRLQLGYTTQQYDGAGSGNSRARRRHSTTTARLVTAGVATTTTVVTTTATVGETSGGSTTSRPTSSLMTVKDLDSGKVYDISRSGNMLLPVMRAVGS